MNAELEQRETAHKAMGDRIKAAKSLILAGVVAVGGMGSAQAAPNNTQKNTPDNQQTVTNSGRMSDDTVREFSGMVGEAKKDFVEDYDAYKESVKNGWADNDDKSEMLEKAIELDQLSKINGIILSGRKIEAIEQAGSKGNMKKEAKKIVKNVSGLDNDKYNELRNDTDGKKVDSFMKDVYKDAKSSSNAAFNYQLIQKGNTK